VDGRHGVTLQGIGTSRRKPARLAGPNPGVLRWRMRPRDPAPIRICFLGDSMVNGTGDDEGLGWVGRICAAARRRGRDVTCHNLGIRRDTSADVGARWRREALLRLPPEHDGRLVFSFGANDCCPDGRGGVRVPHGEALANAQAILSEARSWRPTLMVGPLPICDAAVDARTAALSADLARLCARLDVPFPGVFHLAAGTSTWAREVAEGDGAHPNGGGHAAIAEAVEVWPAWRAWADAPPRASAPLHDDARPGVIGP
jgi:acyl-CoA thioesterase I